MSISICEIPGLSKGQGAFTLLAVQCMLVGIRDFSNSLYQLRLVAVSYPLDFGPQLP